MPCPAQHTACLLYTSLLGFTAQQTLDYLQSLYEKKLCTYPRTDSRYLTGDMADSLPVLVNLVANALSLIHILAYVPVPKDLTKVKTKVMFNLTRRQLVCFTAGALVGVPLFFLLREPAGNSMACLLYTS